LKSRLDAETAPWVTVLAFYKALHQVELLLRLDSRSPSRRGASSHEVRGDLLRNARHYAAVYLHYSALKRASEVARYLEVAGYAYESFAEYMSLDDVRSQVLGHSLLQFESAVGRILVPQHGPDFLTLANSPPPSPGG
jgi:hypothetical protein